MVGVASTTLSGYPLLMTTTRNTRQHEVFNQYGDIVKVLHRGDHESTRAWFLRCKAADEQGLNPPPAPIYR